MVDQIYLSFNASLIECHKYFHLAWENNHAVSANKEVLAKMFTEYMTIVKVWSLLNFHELQTEEFPDFSLLESTKTE